MNLFDNLFGRPSRDKFARQVMAALRAAGDQRAVTYDAANFRLQFEGDAGAGTANLTNFYAEHCNTPRSGRRKHLKHIIRGLLTYLKEVPKEFDEARHDLRPIVRSRSYLELIRLQAQLDSPEPPSIPHHDIGAHLVGALVFDLPESMQTVNQQNLDEWGVTYYEALEAAQQNLAETQFAFAKLGDSLYASLTGDNYDASRLLLPNLIERLEVQGPPVAVVANRDTLLITGRDDEAGLGMLADLAEKALDDPRPLCGIPIVHQGEEWVGWLPERDHPHFQKFRLLEVKTMAGEYGDQQRLLAEWLEKREEDVFVASYTAVRSPAGEVSSYCVWSEGVDSLLPQTHKVMFFRPETQQTVGGEWEHVRTVVGGLLTLVPDMYPPRYRAREFPSEAQLKDLEAAASEPGP
jgi:hypothetical protein